MAVRTRCDHEIMTSASCDVDALHRDGEPVAMQQRCRVRGEQMITCGCRFDEDHANGNRSVEQEDRDA